MGTEFDHIIIGAGSAGCVLANRLSADATRSILVLEAGPMDRNLLIHIPAGVYRVYKDPSLNWNYRAEAEPACMDRAIQLPRGKVIGGSSSINSMVYMRGHPLDYDAWAEECGLPGWSFADCLPYFKRCETYDRGEDQWRGGSGPLGVRQGQLQNELFDAMLLAGEQSGQGRSDDLNGYQPEGIARLDGTVRNGRRCSAATAHLKPALSRPNLTLKTSVLVKRLVIENGRATGVEIESDGQTSIVRASRSVISSCGAIKTPQLLMLSGLGPADHLRSHKIEPILDHPGVGQNLQDHLFVAMAYQCKKPVTLDWLSKPHHKARVGVEWLLTRRGVAASNIWEMGGLVNSNADVPYPNLQYHFTPVYSEFEGRKMKLQQGYQLQTDQLRPKSRGQVTLNSANPSDAPKSGFNYLSDPQDVRELVEGVKKMQELLEQSAFDSYRGQRIDPAPDIRSDSEIEQYVRATASTDYHPCGTCRMGSDNASVVDGEFKVRGIEGLFVVDASVMPRIVSGNLNAPTQMIAERAADIFLGADALPALHTLFHFQN